MKKYRTKFLIGHFGGVIDAYIDFSSRFSVFFEHNSGVDLKPPPRKINLYLFDYYKKLDLWQRFDNKGII